MICFAKIHQKRKKNKEMCRFSNMIQLRVILFICHRMYIFWTLISWAPNLHRHKCLDALDVNIQSFAVPNTNVKFLVMDPDNLIFFRKGREHYSSLFLLHCLLLYFRKINFDTWNQGTDFSKSDQKILTLTACT
jgi:hypothetical protein